MKRISPVEKTRKEIEELLESGIQGEESPLSELMRLAMKKLVEEAFEGRTRDILGRERYERRQGQEGSRNGYRPGRIQSSEGEVEFSVPQLRDVDAGEIRELKQWLQGRTEELERVAMEMWARGCSVRDIEDLFRDERGRSLLSRTAVSEVTEVLWAEYEEFVTRDLSSIELLYLFLDGIAERLHSGARREAVLCAWGITRDGKKVLIHLAPGTKESTECCRDFLEDLKRRGLNDPVLVVSDGAPGLIRAIEECFAQSLRQRCLAHKMRNLAAKLPATIRAEFKQAAKAAYEAPSVAMAKVLRDDVVTRFGKECPTAVRCFEDDFDACIAYLQCPAEHRKVIRTTNLLERLFREERRRTNAATTFFGERPVLKMMFASVVRASDRWRGVPITEFELGQLDRLRQQLIDKHRKENAPLQSRSRSTSRHVYSKKGT